NSGKFATAENLFNSKLTALDSDGQTIAQLAEAVPNVDNGGWTVLSDGTMDTRWTIRSGTVWHDGAPHTTQDLLFTYELEQDRSLPQIRPAGFEFLDRLEAVDSRTIVAHWKQPFIQADAFF